MVPPPNLHQRIKAQLIERLRHHPLDCKLPSVRALAAEFNAAYLTVNGVVNELEWEGYVKRVPRRGTFLASRERTVHTDPQTGTSRMQTVVFAYPNYFSYATWIRLHHAEEQALKRRLALVEFKMNSGPTYDGLRTLVESRDDVCGVIVIPVPGSVSRSEIALFDGLGVPVVLLAPSDFVSLGQNVWSVTTDWYRAGYLQAQRLLTAGHERLAFVRHEPFMSEWQNLLLRGMRQAMREAGKRQRDLRVTDAGTRPWDDSREAAYELTRELVAEAKITGAMYESARGVQGALRALREAGLAAPADLSITAIGRGNGDEEYFSPPITTVDPQPDIELGVTFRCLLAPGQQTGKRLPVEPVLRERMSISAPPGIEVRRFGRAKGQPDVLTHPANK
jgi:DNA-binding LacI/PurR family transcriptional regulator